MARTYKKENTISYETYSKIFAEIEEAPNTPKKCNTMKLNNI